MMRIKKILLESSLATLIILVMLAGSDAVHVNDAPAFALSWAAFRR